MPNGKPELPRRCQYSKEGSLVLLKGAQARAKSGSPFLAEPVLLYLGDVPASICDG